MAEGRTVINLTRCSLKQGTGLSGILNIHGQANEPWHDPLLVPGHMSHENISQQHYSCIKATHAVEQSIIAPSFDLDETFLGLSSLPLTESDNAPMFAALPAFQHQDQINNSYVMPSVSSVQHPVLDTSIDWLRRSHQTTDLAPPSNCTPDQCKRFENSRNKTLRAIEPRHTISEPSMAPIIVEGPKRSLQGCFKLSARHRKRQNPSEPGTKKACFRCVAQKSKVRTRSIAVSDVCLFVK